VARKGSATILEVVTMNKTWYVSAAMILCFGMVAVSIPTTATIAIGDLALIKEVQPTVTLASGTRHANHKTHKNEDPGFGPIGGGATRPAPQVSL
jgi:hypothetical protein